MVISEVLLCPMPISLFKKYISKLEELKIPLCFYIDVGLVKSAEVRYSSVWPSSLQYIKKHKWHLGIVLCNVM